MRLLYILTSVLLLSACAKAPVPPPDTAVYEPPVPEAAPVMAQEVVTAAIGDDDPMTRALAAKQLASAFNDLNSINSMDRIIEFKDTEPGAWYDKYINAVYTGGIMNGSDGLFQPDAYVTLAQAQTLLDRLDAEKRIRLKLTAETEDKPISYALWLELFGKLLEGLGGASEKFDIQERRLVVLATAANNSRLGQWSVVTDIGPYTCVGLNLDAYIDRELRVLVKDGDIVAVLAVENLSPTIANAYLAGIAEGEVRVFSGGAERSYAYSGAAAAVGSICDITLSADGEAVGLEVFTDTRRGRVLLTTAERIEFEDAPTLEIGAGFKVYDSTGEYVSWKALSDIIVGTDIAEFIMRDGKAAAAVITRKADPTVLRVAISNANYGGLYHDSLSVSGTKAFSIRSLGDGAWQAEYDAWQETPITDSMFEEGSRVIVEAEDGGKIVLMGVKRAWPGAENPKYRGTVEIYKDTRGYLVVNTLSMEEYLYAVVPSEMPSGYGVDASKVQAITARSYAYNQFYANRFHAYGANIDDSVSCQVYNNIPENDTAISAVDDTRGQALGYRGNVVSANFFSTSSGYTANSGEVWAHGATRQFPTSSAEYLRSAKLFEGKDYDLTDEAAAAEFYKDLSIKAYDSDVSWFRWNVRMTAGEIAAAVNAGLAARYAANAPLIKTLQDGVFRSRPIERIGELVELEVIRRGQAGNIMEMKVTGTEATVLLLTEYNVRALIKPVQLTGGEPIILRRHDGTEVADYSIMPSAFYVMDKVYDGGKLAAVEFSGGGNGHGVGMSQNGVRGMLAEGLTIPQILQYFYKGTDIIEVY